MAEINLRTYIHEIDDLIEEGKHLEEAIAHCRHILKVYPKHIDTYRLLGKAYLESKQYGDAGDIFQRVLSAIPNDFVSHVGMAVIREDEGNLDAAIWHMERSSETQPGNAAIEEELKRLIGKRDGIEPQRVRPTRGALARMYYHGELYSYATNELKTALEEDTDRPDLQVLLADTYWRTNQRLEAADLCGQILEKLPYCFLANQITAALLQATGKSEESAVNLRRLIALDPYMAFIENPIDNPGTIDANAVPLEKLYWSPGQPLPSSEIVQPDWAASLGVPFKGEGVKAAGQEEMPSWLLSQPGPEQKSATPEAAPIHPFAGAKPPVGADIPDWMRESGWVEGSGEATEGPIEFTQIPEAQEDLSSVDRPLEAANLPSWLSEITDKKPIQEEAPAPKTPISKSILPSEEKESIQLPNWIREIHPGAREIEPGPLDLTAEEEVEFDLSSTKRESSGFDLSGEEEAEGLEGIFAEEESIESEIPEYPPWLERSSPGATDTIVSWLGEKTLEEAAPAEDIPTWMRGTGPLEDPASRKRVTPEQKPSKEPLAPPPPIYEEIKEISEDLGESILIEEEPVSLPPVVSETPEWLDEISGFKEELPIQEPVKSEEAPEWLKEASSEEEEVPIKEEAPPPAWLGELEEEFIEKTSEEIEISKEVLEPREKPPDWLSEVLQENILGEEEKIPEKPDWLEGVVEPEMILPEEGVTDFDEAPEWLAAMSMIEEVDTSPTEEREEPPEWLKGLSEPEPSHVEEKIAEQEAQPEWLTKESFPEPEEETKAIPETPEWLRELTEVPIESAQPSDIALEPATQGETVQEEPPDWLHEIVETPLEFEEISGGTPEEPSELAIEGEALPEMELMDRLRDISAVPSELKIDKEEVIVPEGIPLIESIFPEVETPEPSIFEKGLPTEEVPEWMKEMEGVSISEEATIDEYEEKAPTPSLEIKELAAEEAPDWLQEMVGPPVEEFAVEESIQEIQEPLPSEALIPETDPEGWLRQIDQATSLVEETTSAEAEVEQLQEVTEITPELKMEPPQEVEELPIDTFPTAPLDETIILEKIEETIEAEAISEEPDWLKATRLDEILKAETPTYEIVDQIQEVQESPLEAEVPAGEIKEESVWQPEFATDEIESEITPESIEGFDVERLEAGFEESFDWLQETAMEVSPEPEVPSQPVKPAYTSEQLEDLTASMEGPIDDEEVFTFLEGLATQETIKEQESPFEAQEFIKPEPTQEFVEEQLIQEHALPEELDESLDWLELLAAEEPMEDFTPPVFVEGLEDEEEAEIPRWLEEVAEKSEEPLIADKDLEEAKGPQKIIEEPVPSIPPISTIETIISERPGKELPPQQELEKEIPEERPAEPVPMKGYEPEKEEWGWELEAKQKEIPPIKEAPPTIPGTELPIAEIPIEMIPTETKVGKVGLPTPPVEEPIVDPFVLKLKEARHALGNGQIEVALGHYSNLIEEKAEMTEVIQDLRNAIEKTPREPMLWQTLGDALMKVGQLSDAISAYRRGMEAI